MRGYEVKSVAKSNIPEGSTADAAMKVVFVDGSIIETEVFASSSSTPEIRGLPENLGPSGYMVLHVAKNIIDRSLVV